MDPWSITLTDFSKLNGRATITSFISLQFVTETEDDRTNVLHFNALEAGDSKQATKKEG